MLPRVRHSSCWSEKTGRKDLVSWRSYFWQCGPFPRRTRRGEKRSDLSRSFPFLVWWCNYHTRKLGYREEALKGGEFSQCTFHQYINSNTSTYISKWRFLPTPPVSPTFSELILYLRPLVLPLELILSSPDLLLLLRLLSTLLTQPCQLLPAQPSQQSRQPLW